MTDQNLCKGKQDKQRLWIRELEMLKSPGWVYCLSLLFFFTALCFLIPDTSADVIRASADRAFPDGADIRRDPGRNTITFLKGKNLSHHLEQEEGFQQLQLENRYSEMAVSFLNHYRKLFHLVNPSEEVQIGPVNEDRLGFKQVRIQQFFVGIPVFGGEMIVHLDQANHIVLIQGRYIPTPSGLSINPTLSVKEARKIVAGHLEGMTPDCPGCKSEVMIFAGSAHVPHLVYRVLASPGFAEGWAVMVDAQTGIILEKFSTVQTR